MYSITLTSDERKAFDWVGDRYSAGDVGRLLWLDCCPENAEWDSEDDITFAIPEHVAWQICELVEDEGFTWPCFAPELTAKLIDLCNSVV